LLVGLGGESSYEDTIPIDYDLVHLASVMGQLMSPQSSLP